MFYDKNCPNTKQRIDFEFRNCSSYNLPEAVIDQEDMK